MHNYPIVKVLCRTCRQKNNHEILQTEPVKLYDEVDWSWFGEEVAPTPFAEEHWNIVRCCGCETLAFYAYETPFFEEEGPGIRNERIYPQPALHAHPVKVFKRLPLTVRETYTEVVEGYNKGLYRLSVMGVRMVIEGICLDLGIEGNLSEKIDRLKQREFLSATHAQILHELRKHGNDAAHRLYRPKRDELRQLIEALETTLHVVYELEQIAANMQVQRQQRLSSP